MSRFVAFLASCLVVLFGWSAHAAIFTNGSFETGPSVSAFTTLQENNTSIAGWTVTVTPSDLNSDTTLDYIGSLWAAAHGSRSIDLNGLEPAAIFQTFDTLVGQEYLVLFDMAGNPDAGPAIKTLAASVGAFNQSYSFDSTTTTRSAMGWETKAFSFVATGPSSTLTFASTTAGFSGNNQFPQAFGPAIDNVRVFATPAPAPLLIWSLGALGCAMGAYRRRKRA
jgi:choice-of-anchor C domain-containing protein